MPHWARRNRDAAGHIDNAVMVLHGTGGSGGNSSRRNSPTSFTGRPAARPRATLCHPARRHRPWPLIQAERRHAMRFPHYDYDDMVEAQRQLLARLGVARLRLLMGTSMGCMHGFVWAESHAEMLRAIMPMACLPAEIAGRNRMWRRMAVEAIRRDPAWAEGNYTAQPVEGLRAAVSLLQVAGLAPQYAQRSTPTRAAADAFIVPRVEADIATATPTI